MGDHGWLDRPLAGLDEWAGMAVPILGPAIWSVYWHLVRGRLVL